MFTFIIYLQFHFVTSTSWRRCCLLFTRPAPGCVCCSKCILRWAELDKRGSGCKTAKMYTFVRDNMLFDLLRRCYLPDIKFLIWKSWIRQSGLRAVLLLRSRAQTSEMHRASEFVMQYPRLFLRPNVHYSFFFVWELYLIFHYVLNNSCAN